MTAYCVNEIGIDQLLADVMTQHPVHTRNKMLRVLLSQLSSEKNPISPAQATPYPAGSVFCRKSYSKVEELCWRAVRIPPAKAHTVVPGSSIYRSGELNLKRASVCRF